MRLLFTISFLSGGFLFGQTYTVTNDKTGEGVQGVFVYSKTNQEGVLSDKDGVVDLSSFGDDELLYFQHLQYKPYRIKKSELSGQTKVLLCEKATVLPLIYYDHPLRYSVDKDGEAGQIESIPREIVKIENPATSADMLQNTGNVLVQKSQGGGGSPIIRGFEANKLLLVIDGVRMNNAIYRSGHLQNSITVDNAVLDHTEIIFGPSSSLYGSDALGGVIHFHTRDPKITGADTAYFEGSTYMRYNTNNNTMSGHFDFSTGKKKWALLSSITATKYGNIVMGSNRVLHGDSLWGLHPNIIVDTQPGDSVIANLDPRLQVGTGFTQFDVMQKFIYRAHDRVKYTFNLQFSTSSKIDRYDKLTEYSGNEPRFAEWHYGPQTRFLGQIKVDFSRRPSYGYKEKKRHLYNSGALSVAYQRIDEDRISRRLYSSERMHQEEDLDIISLNLDFNRVFSQSKALFYGLEAQHNIVSSTAFSENIITSSTNDGQTRYPGASNYLSSGVYLEYKQKFKNNASFTTGMRYSFIYAKSDFTDTAFIALPFNQVNLATSAPSGNIGLVLRPDSLTRVRFQATTGFRAPNIDDYGKVFEKTGITVVPNDQLKPEYAVGAEASFERTLFKNFLTIGATVYGTYLFNAMVQRDFQLNGADSILYQGDMTKIQAIVNTDNAIVYGTSANLTLNFTEQIHFDYTYNFTKGTDLTANMPLEHIPPQFGKIVFGFKGAKMNTAIYSFYNFRKRGIDYAPGGDNIDLTPNGDGIPAWWTLNYRFSYRFWEKVDIQFAVENILDVHYRQFASGISQPGRNFMISLKADF